jgi:hypothetical protein
MPAYGIWTPMGQPVPVDRAISNVQAQLKDHPNDAAAWLVLGRLHSYAFFVGKPQIPMRNGRPYISDMPEVARTTEPTAPDLAHLKESILAFRKSLELDKNAELPYLGLGWDLEQGARYADRVGPIQGEEGAWTDRALAYYRQAYERASKGDLAMQYYAPGYQAISLEAAGRIVAIDQEILKQPQEDHTAARAEIARLQPAIANLRKKPRAITPVIFSFREGTLLRDMVAPDVRVAFDLDGLGGSTWTWLKPSTGILVWDPKQTGSIQSGLQLFGSVTWWMFWRDGFQALSALDDNHDGWLSGGELTGIAVWIDRNQNGRSDAGEVISLAEAGITRIRAIAQMDASGVLGNVRGIEFSDGRQTPAYDWVSQGFPQAQPLSRNRTH